jgi:transposase
MTPGRHDSGETSRNRRISKCGDTFTRKCPFEAANAIFCRNLGGDHRLNRAKAIAKRTGPKKAKVA